MWAIGYVWMTVISRIAVVLCWMCVGISAVSQAPIVFETVHVNMRRLWCVREAVSAHSICSMRALCEFTLHAVDVWHALFYPVLSLSLTENPVLILEMPGGIERKEWACLKAGKRWREKDSVLKWKRLRCPLDTALLMVDGFKTASLNRATGMMKFFAVALLISIGSF